jgi:hypothetical protein
MLALAAVWIPTALLSLYCFLNPERKGTAIVFVFLPVAFVVTGIILALRPKLQDFKVGSYAEVVRGFAVSVIDGYPGVSWCFVFVPCGQASVSYQTATIFVPEELAWALGVRGAEAISDVRVRFVDDAGNMTKKDLDAVVRPVVLKDFHPKRLNAEYAKKAATAVAL